MAKKVNKKVEEFNHKQQIINLVSSFRKDDIKELGEYIPEVQLKEESIFKLLFEMVEYYTKNFSSKTFNIKFMNNIIYQLEISINNCSNGSYPEFINENFNSLIEMIDNFYRDHEFTEPEDLKLRKEAMVDKFNNGFKVVSKSNSKKVEKSSDVSGNNESSLKLEKELSKKQAKIEELITKTDKASEELRTIKQEVSEYKKENTSLKNTNNSLLGTIEKKNKEIDELKNCQNKSLEEQKKDKKEKELLLKQLDSLQAQISNFNHIKFIEEAAEILFREILTSSTKSIDFSGLRKSFSNFAGSSYTFESFLETIKVLKAKYKIDVKGIKNDKMIFTFNPSLFNRNDGIKNFNISTSNNSVDMLYICDSHIIDFDKKVEKYYDAIYDYCSQVGIRYIIDAGDRFDNMDLIKKPDNYFLAKSLVDGAITKLPFDKDIITLYMGGNHEKKTLSFGYDQVASLAHNRSDYVDMGYSNSIITFNKKDAIGLHHIDVGTDLNVSEQIKAGESVRVKSILKDFYLDSGTKPYDMYLDTFAHLHYNEYISKDNAYFFGASKVAYSTPLVYDIHINLNSNGEISNMLITTWDLNNKRAIGTIEHTKTLKPIIK